MSACGRVHRSRSGALGRRGRSVAGRRRHRQDAWRLCCLARPGAGVPVKSGPGKASVGSVGRLDRVASPGPVRGFTMSTRGRDSLPVDDGRRDHACPALRWAQLCTPYGSASPPILVRLMKLLFHPVPSEKKFQSNAPRSGAAMDERNAGHAQHTPETEPRRPKR